MTRGNMDILVVGAGTVGSVVGGYLSASGCNVILADGWDKNVDVLNREGLKLSGTRGEHHFWVKAVHLGDVPKLKEEFKVIIISVKTYDTQKTLDLIRPLIKTDTVVISTQNGINEEFIAKEIGSSHVIGAVTELSGYMLGPGMVVETRKDGGFVLGELDGSASERVQDLGTVMAACGKIKISENIMGILWSKLIWNSMLNPLTAISGLGTGSILQHDKFRKLAIEIGKEGFCVSKKHNIKLEPLVLMGIDIRRLDPEQPLENIKEENSLKLLPEPLDKMPSMAQDIKNARKTEIDFINGVIFEYGKKLQVATPINEKVINTLHLVEKNQDLQSPVFLNEILFRFKI